MPLTIRSTLVAAVLAGLLAGLAFFAVQLVTTRPLIVQAEVLERAQPPATTAAPAHDHAAHAHAHAWEPEDGAERTLYTLAADLMVGIGYGFLLVGMMVLAGRPLSATAGLLWGLAGFVAFAAAPALGLPPEPPGVPGADLVARQAWWLGTAAASAAGLWALLLGRAPWWRVAGLLLLVVPHIVGAPRPPDALLPDDAAALAQRFHWAALAATAVLWAVLGSAAGWLLPRMAQPGPMELPRAA